MKKEREREGQRQYKDSKQREGVNRDKIKDKRERKYFVFRERKSLRILKARDRK